MVLWEWRGKRGKTTGFFEEGFSSGVRELVDPRTYSCYVLEGHGGKDPEKDFPFLKQKLEEENYVLRVLSLEEVGEIPRDAELIFWIGPKEPLLEKEAALLETYLANGGRMVICLDPLVAAASGTSESFFSTLGIALDSRVVVDTRSQLFRGDFFFATATRYPTHAITRGLNKVSVFPLARPLSIRPKRLDPKRVEVELYPLAETSETAWAESDKDSLRSAAPRFDPTLDLRGPLVLAMAGELQKLEPTLTQKGGRFVLFGDSDFLTDRYVKVGNNLDLFLNAVAWAVEREDGITLRPKDPLHHPIILSRSETLLIGIFVIGVIPGIWVALGVYNIRRSRRSHAVSQ